MEDIKKYIESKLHHLELFGGIDNRNGYYCFNAEAEKNQSIDFENSIFEVVSVKITHLGSCFINLKIEKNFADFCVKNKKTPSVKEVIKALEYRS